MRNKILLLVLIFNISIVVCDMKIGWVNTQKILSESEDVNRVYAETEKERKRLDLEFEQKKLEFDSLYTDYETRRLVFTAEKVQEIEQKLNLMQQELQLFVQNVNSPNGELAVYFNSLMAPIEERIYTAIQKVSIELEYDYVLDCSTGVCLYQKEAHNLTGLVQDELKKMAIDSVE